MPEFGTRYLAVQIDIPMRGESGFDSDDFSRLQKWVEAYRERRYPGLWIEYERFGRPHA
jgi:hypothetical protein